MFCFTFGKYGYHKVKSNALMNNINPLEQVRTFLEMKVKLKQFRHRPGVSQRVPGS